MIRKTKFMSLLAVAFVLAALNSSARAAGPAECGLIGTWYGNAGDDMYWLGVQTAGTTHLKGEMLLDWVAVNPNLFGPGATRLTNGRGVWEQTSSGQYKYVWYAYGVDSPNGNSYAIRVTGVAKNKDCNTVNIDYLYEIFDANSWPQDFSGSPLYSTAGSAIETRVPAPASP